MFDAHLPRLVFHSRGNIELLSQNKLAVFASRETPEELFEPALAFFSELLQLPISLAGGWQSNLEKQLLTLFNTQATANLIQYFAREINHLKLESWQQALLNENKLLIISPETSQQRPNQGLVSKRDNLIFSHCQKVLFFYIQPGGRLQAYFDQLLKSGSQLFLFEHPTNEKQLSSDVVFINTDNLEPLLIGR